MVSTLTTSFSAESLVFLDGGSCEEAFPPRVLTIAPTFQKLKVSLVSKQKQTAVGKMSLNREWADLKGLERPSPVLFRR